MAERKTVIVTGASEGFGGRSGQVFARSGWRVVAAARNIGKLTSLSQGAVCARRVSRRGALDAQRCRWSGYQAMMDLMMGEGLGTAEDVIPDPRMLGFLETYSSHEGRLRLSAFAHLVQAAVVAQGKAAVPA